MTARVFGPIEVEPGAVWPPYERGQFLGSAQLYAALLDAVQGVELGDYDRATLRWLAGWETGTVAVVVSLLHRARAVGAAENVEGGA